jgi:tetratricopeptide (TPR) repeat protein/tRNA A-37 threonylcarbamoyl transferase component Bud32
MTGERHGWVSTGRLLQKRALRLAVFARKRAGDWLRTYQQSDPAGATILTEYLTFKDDLEGFMTTRAPDVLADDELPLAETDNRVGPWRLVRLIGKGGMGQVWQARRDDGVYDQIAALKLLAVDHAVLRERFASERQRLAQLEHPHIARIIDGGDDGEGRPYMVMEYVEGEQLIDWCDTRKLDRKTRVALLIELCAALSHAHGRLVLHLDIKPANVLINADGNVRLIDFGIAALLDDSRIATPIRALTLATAAPEQLLGQTVSAATDIFQAGMLGHAVLTGQLPERQSDGSVKIDTTRLHDRDLAAIIGKACATDPERRYGSASAMGDDLRNWATGFPVAARAGGLLYHGGLLVKRHKTAAAGVGIALTALVGGLGISLWQMQQAINARNLAIAEEERSDSIREALYFLLAEDGAVGGNATSALGLAASAERIGARFDAAPQQYAAVLQALGELQFYLSDDVAAIKTFDRLLGRAAALDPDIVASARYNAAQAHMRQGETDKAQALLIEAQGFWLRDPGRWAMRLTDSRLLEAQVKRQSEPEAAVALLESTLADHIRRHGEDNQRSGVFYNNIGVTLAGMNRLDEAGEAFGKANAVWQRTGLTNGFDALNTVNNLASVQYLGGDLPAAAQSFERAVKLRQELFGPSAATAALLSNYGKALLGTNREAQALEQFAAAEPMAVQYAGNASPLVIAIKLGRGEALAKAGETGALGELEAARSMIAKLGNPAALLAAHQLALGKVHQAERRPAEAQAAWREAVQLSASAGPAAERVRAEAASLVSP